MKLWPSEGQGHRTKKILYRPLVGLSSQRAPNFCIRGTQPRGEGVGGGGEGHILIPSPCGGGPKLLSRLLRQAQRVVGQIPTPYPQEENLIGIAWKLSEVIESFCVILNESHGQHN